MNWPLSEAKNKLSEVVRLALEEGPQKITRRNDCVIVMAEKDFLKLKSSKKDFKQFLLSSGTAAILDMVKNEETSGDTEL